MGESRRGDPNRFKREGAKGWVSIPRRKEPRFDYPVPCINDVVEVREVVWLYGSSGKIEKPVGTCIVYGMTTELVICKKICDNGVFFDMSLRKKDFKRGGLLFGLADDDKMKKLRNITSL